MFVDIQPEINWYSTERHIRRSIRCTTRCRQCQWLTDWIGIGIVFCICFYCFFRKIAKNTIINVMLILLQPKPMLLQWHIWQMRQYVRIVQQIAFTSAGAHQKRHQSRRTLTTNPINCALCSICPYNFEVKRRWIIAIYRSFALTHVLCSSFNVDAIFSPLCLSAQECDWWKFHLIVFLH